MGVSPALGHGLCSYTNFFFLLLTLAIALMILHCIALALIRFLIYWRVLLHFFTTNFFIVNACDYFDDIVLHCTSINSVFDLLESLATLFQPADFKNLKYKRSLLIFDDTQLNFFYPQLTFFIFIYCLVWYT